MKTKYIKIQLGEPNEDKDIFVREKDFKEMQKALRGKKSNRIVKSVINVLLGSPDGLHDLAEGISLAGYIFRTNDIGILENFKDMINYQIKKVKNIKEVKQWNKKQNKKKSKK